MVKGTTYAVADIGRAATLATLRIKVNRVQTARSFPPQIPGDAPTIAHGTFVTVNVTVTNRLSDGYTFSTVPYGQAAILFNGREYRTDPGPAPVGDPHSFASQSNDDVSPGESETGDLVFDLPTSIVSDVLKHGALVVSDFNWAPENTDRVVLLKLS